MKRIKQLQPLSMEHHLSLSLASKAIKMADNGSADDIKKMCDDIVLDYPSVWRKHFDKEENFIFTRFALPDVDPT